MSRSSKFEAKFSCWSVIEVIQQANDTTYGLAAAVFTQNINRAIESAHKLHAGTAWVCGASQASN